MDVPRSSKPMRRDRYSRTAPIMAALVYWLASWSFKPGKRDRYPHAAPIDAVRPATCEAFEASKLGSTPRTAASNPMPPARTRLSYGCQGGSAPPFGTMLPMLDGKEHADCESVGKCSNHCGSTNYRISSAGERRSPKPRQRGFDPCIR